MKTNLKLIFIGCILVVLFAIVVAFEPTDDTTQVETATQDRSIETVITQEPSISFYSTSTESDRSLKPKPLSQVTPSANASPVSAKAYLVGNVQTGKIYMKKNAEMILPVASMSKLITAIETIDTMNTTDPITVTQEELNIFDTGSFRNGEVFTVNELLHSLLLSSSNLAAEALASSTNRAKFLEKMSSYAWEIGMPSTYFADPSGIDPHNISTANDFFALAKYLYTSRPDILAITRTSEYAVATTTLHGSHDFVNIHPFVKDPDFLGGKTGHTPEAKDTMLTIINVNGEPLAIIVLASDNRKKDTAYLVGKARK